MNGVCYNYKLTTCTLFYEGWWTSNMADLSPFQQHFKSMLALGRHFQIGDLYDYHADRIVLGK